MQYFFGLFRGSKPNPKQAEKQMTATKVKALKSKSKQMEYAGEIYKYLRRVERVFSPKDQYLAELESFRTGERMKVVEWMIDVVERFKLKRQTLYSGMSLFDRYCELKAPKTDRLGILALTSIFIAYKFEEVAYLFRDVLAYKTYQGKNHTVEEIYEFEVDVLESLGWRLCHLGAMSFFDVLGADIDRESECYKFAESLASCMLLSGLSITMQCSLLGSAILYLVFKFFGIGHWTMEATLQSLYTENQVKQAAHQVIELLQREHQRIISRDSNSPSESKTKIISIHNTIKHLESQVVAIVASTKT